MINLPPGNSQPATVSRASTANWWQLCGRLVAAPATTLGCMDMGEILFGGRYDNLFQNLLKREGKKGK
jgi:hypothetical protein